MRLLTVTLITACVSLFCAGQMKPLSPAHSSTAAPTKALPNGTWGGEHIRMEVNDGGADIEFDCAKGSISQRLQLDDKGRFNVQGIYIAETPAPVSVDGSTGIKATYIGTLNGDRRWCLSDVNPLNVETSLIIKLKALRN